MGQPLRVVVAGAGLGGLALAQGLVRGGADVTVLERAAGTSPRGQGYRLHVDARAGLALRECLPPDLLDLFLATCGSPSRRLTVLDERLRTLHTAATEPAADPYDPATLSTSVNRLTLLQVLAAGLGPRLERGAQVAAYEQDEAEVRVRLTDGRSLAADLLVGADGVGSVVRRQYLPHAAAQDTGGRCVYGRTTLTEPVLRLLPPAMLEGFTAVVGGRVGLATGLVRLRNRPELAGRQSPARVALTPVPDYLMWAVSTQQRDLPVDDAAFAGMAPDELHALATRMVGTWDPSLRELVRRGEPGDSLAVRVRASVPVAAWPPSRVTVLGDAIHAMTPAGGSGANCALADAASLTRALRASCPAGASREDLLDSVGGYEDTMRRDGYAAVAAAQAAESRMGGRRHRFLGWLSGRRG